MSKYIIIDAEAIQKRINDLKKSLLISETNNDTIRAGIETSEIKQLEWCLSQSTPLIPEIEKAVLEGVNSIHFENDGSHWREDDVVETYISNLKLDI